MLYISNATNNIVDTENTFKGLVYSDISDYIQMLKDLGGFLEIVNSYNKDTKITHIVVKTLYGECMLDEIATSLKILVLAQIAIKQKLHVSFVAGEIAGNYLKNLYDICKDTDYVSLYQPDGFLPYMCDIIPIEFKDCR